MWIMRTSCVQRLQQFSHSEGHTQLTDWRRSNPIQSRCKYLNMWVSEYVSIWVSEQMSTWVCKWACDCDCRRKRKEKLKTENHGSVDRWSTCCNCWIGSLRLNDSIRSCHLKRSETWTIATPPSSHGELHKKPHKHHVSNINGVPRSGLPYQLLLLLLLLPLLLLHCTPNWSSKLQFNPFTTALSGCAINLYWAQNVREIRKAKTE